MKSNSFAGISDSVQISNSRWAWHFILVRSVFWWNFVQKDFSRKSHSSKRNVSTDYFTIFLMEEQASYGAILCLILGWKCVLKPWDWFWIANSVFVFNLTPSSNMVSGTGIASFVFYRKGTRRSKMCASCRSVRVSQDDRWVCSIYILLLLLLLLPALSVSLPEVTSWPAKRSTHNTVSKPVDYLLACQSRREGTRELEHKEKQ